MTGSREIFWLACASAIVTANAYYIHPIIAAVARDFGVSNAGIGIVPAVNQIALALGVLLLLPLGDRVDNRKLVTLCLSVQVLTLVAMAVTTSFVVFITASTALGFFTITPYLLPAYASRRVTPQQLGYATALLTTGVIAGVQSFKTVCRRYWSLYRLALGLLDCRSSNGRRRHHRAPDHGA